VEDWRNGGFGLYLHWPFCASKCPYCDFNSHVAAEIDQNRWKRAYLGEIARVGALTHGRVLNTVFFGGGTPSLMDPESVAGILDAVHTTWAVASDLEITLEANPGSVEAGRFRAYAEAGVNRISMGIQALNDADLTRLGRLHSAAEAEAAFDVARAAFERISFDLIYARQDQTLARWETELRAALSMAADHISLYQLTIESGTAFGARHAAGGLRGLPDDDLAADMYLLTQDICADAGLPAYEVSNHARPGSESRHNLIYWRAGDYAGIGPGAHGRLTLGGTRQATETLHAPGAWLAQVESRGHGEVPMTAVSAVEQSEEYLMMSMRLREGMDVARYAALAGRAPDAVAIAHLIDDGMIRSDGGRIIATDQGRAVLNAVIRALA
jgi:putative oxygen-independent coproporphyrinogen III oxidase